MLRGWILLLALAACGGQTRGPAGKTPVDSYQVIGTYPHDSGAFTEGLFYLNGFLYEATGMVGASSLRKIDLKSGQVMQIRQVPRPYFGEGIVAWKGRLIQLTYRTQVGFVYDLETFAPIREFSYPGEGWSLTHDGKRIIMSDGTSELRFWDPETFGETGRLRVTDAGQPVSNLNELEWVKGEIYANVWQTDRIARIDPASGRVLGWIDLAGLWPGSDLQEKTLNGIAYDADQDRLFVTGKEWPSLFEIRISRRGRLR